MYFIYEFEYTKWVFTIIVTPKNIGMQEVCVNIKKVNVAIVRDYCPLLITDHVCQKDGYKGILQLLKLVSWIK